jgi:hypothetical protein
MRLVTESFARDEWTETGDRFTDLNLIQTWEYGEAKAQSSSWKVERGIFLDREDVVGAVQAAVRAIPGLGGGLVWINRGPLWRQSGDGNDGALMKMLEELRNYWVDGRGMYLRIALPLRDEEVQPEVLDGSGYLPSGSPGWASGKLDLSLPLVALRGRLRQRWRSYISCAERLGMSASFSTAAESFEEFLRAYRRLLEERKFKTSVTPALLSRLQALLPEERKLVVCTAEWQGQLLGRVLIARYGDTAEYLAGTIEEAGKGAHAGLFLLWQAVREMKRRGYRWFDLGGMNPQATPSGIFQFKAGFRPILYQLTGELEAHDGGWRSRLVRKCIRIAGYKTCGHYARQIR